MGWLQRVLRTLPSPLFSAQRLRGLASTASKPLSHHLPVIWWTFNAGRGFLAVGGLVWLAQTFRCSAASGSVCALCLPVSVKILCRRLAFVVCQWDRIDMWPSFNPRKTQRTVRRESQTPPPRSNSFWKSQLKTSPSPEPVPAVQRRAPKTPQPPRFI